MAKREDIEHGRQLLLLIGGNCEESWQQSDRTFEHAAELAEALARVVGRPEYDDASGEYTYLATVEQACAVPAATQNDRARVELAESIVGVVLGDLFDRGALDSAFARWGASTHQEVRRELTGKVNDALAPEAGKAQAEWTSVIDELPKLFELVQFATPESAGPTIGKFNGVRWMALFDLSRPGLIDYGKGQVSHWRRLPPPPSAPEGT